jgi:two-component system OmpR family response regulator
MRILLVEDDRPLSLALSTSLRNENYVIDAIFNGKDAIATAESQQTDLVVLDLGLPDMDGISVLKSIRNIDSNIPIIILTARDTLKDKVVGLDSGADDYLPKPFDMTELLARIRVIERRLNTAGASEIILAEVSLDIKHHIAKYNGNPIDFSRREFMVLKALMENAGRILSKQQLESKLYEWGDEVSSNTIEVHVHHLRKKLPFGFISTVRGVGYTIPK